MNNRVILYFGSFNPVHNGHLSIANYVIENGLCDEIWFIVSPHNPLKREADLLPEEDRFEMTRLASAEWGSAIKVLDIEFSMSRPSYTIQTIKKLESLYSGKKFTLLMGEDNILYFDCWKQWQEIVRRCDVLIYPRGDVSTEIVHDKIRELRLEGEFPVSKFNYLPDAPRIDLSSTELRRLKYEVEGKTAQSVVNYINEKKLYDSK